MYIVVSEPWLRVSDPIQYFFKNFKIQTALQFFFLFNSRHWQVARDKPFIFRAQRIRSTIKMELTWNVCFRTNGSTLWFQVQNSKPELPLRCRGSSPTMGVEKLHCVVRSALTRKWPDSIFIQNILKSKQLCNLFFLSILGNGKLHNTSLEYFKPKESVRPRKWNLREMPASR